MSIYSKFSQNLQLVLKRSVRLVQKYSNSSISDKHLLYCLITQRGSLAQEILKKANVNKIILSQYLKNTATPSEQGNEIDTCTYRNEFPKTSKKQVALTLQSKKIIEKAVLIASLQRHHYVGTEHLLYSILTNPTQELKHIFKKQKINYKKLQYYTIEVIKSSSKFAEMVQLFSKNEESHAYTMVPRTSASSKKSLLLDEFADELTSEKIQRNIDPVIEREQEIDRIIHILLRRTKNNPILLGDPGVGKTAIVEGLAKKILTGNITDILINKRIYRLDLSLLVAGTMFRGQFEQRLKQLLYEIKQDPDIILFIDELHTIIGTGASAGSLDVANILKPALARGEIRCIGATTYEEYKKHIQNDPALERRFQVIHIKEPSIEKTTRILQGIKNKYETFHNVTIQQDAIEEAIKLSNTYLGEKFFPDKAIDLIDEAAAFVRIKHNHIGFGSEIKRLQSKLEQLEELKQKSILQEKYDQAIVYRKQEEDIKKQLENLQIKKKNLTVQNPILTAVEIRQVMEQITGFPILANTKELNKTSNEIKHNIQLFNLEKIMGREIVGQDKAIKTIADLLRCRELSLEKPQNPRASFLLVGPNGVGKTYITKVLAKTLFSGLEHYLKIDMAEYQDSITITKLIGAPAGYVGYKEPNKLTDHVKRYPFSVIVFDEIEKAHPDVLQIIKQILEEGSIVDASNKRVDFTNTIIFATSSIGAHLYEQEAGLGFETSIQKKTKNIKNTEEDLENEIQKELHQTFTKDFLERIQTIITLSPLTKQHLQKIMEQKIKKLCQNLKQEKNIVLDIEKDTLKYLLKSTYTRGDGARGIIKIIKEKIEMPLTRDFLMGKIRTGQHISLRIIKDNGKERIIIN